MDRRQATSRGETLPEKAVGAVVLADVSGFTPLTESLERALGSQRGSEELSFQLNRVYSCLIAEVHSRRGSVIGFSGDAITCWFDGDDGRRATACALDMQRVMAELPSFETPDGVAIPLGIKVAVSQGSVRRLLVGDPRIRVFDVVVGSTLERMASAERLARQGEVVVGPQVLTTLGDSVRIGGERRDAQGRRFAVVGGLEEPPPARDPWPSPAPGALAEEQIRPFLEREVYDRLRTGQAQFLAEIRPVVPLFLSFEGLDFDRDEKVGAKLDRYIREVQAIVHRFDGSLIDLTVGDKGAYLFATFGAPIAHEDDAARAVAAALELRALSLQMPGIQEPRIGLSQGRLYAGPSGSAARQTYTVLGDETNLAARLMGHARAGQVLASDRVAGAAEGYRYRNLGAIALKGKQHPLVIHEVLRPRSVPASEGRGRRSLVGRRRERELLTGLLSRLIEHGEQALVILEGDAGIGKSCLLEQHLGLARDLGLDAFAGAADAVASATPYHAWRPIWRALLDLEAAGSPLERQRVLQVLGALGDRRSVELAPLLNPVLFLDLEPTRLTAQLHGEPRAESTRDLLVRMLRHFTSQRPLLLVLEDAHWLDSASWELIEALSREAMPLVLILATRPSGSEGGGKGRRLLERGVATLMPLEALTHAEVLELVSRRLGVAALPEQLAVLLRERAEGNPFFSEELAYALRDAGLIRIDGGRCRLAPGVGDLMNLDFPETIEGIVTSRLDRLGAAEQLTVKVASVVGRVFARNLLHDIHPIAADRRDLGSHLDHLEKLDIARPFTPEPPMSYIFKHIITQVVAYNRMVFVQRRQLHQQVALWYEARRPEGLSKLSPLLAHHWSQAIEGAPEPSPQLLSKAIGYLEAAGEQALHNHASREVIAYLEKALCFDDVLRRLPGSGQMTATAERRSRWHSWLGRSHLALGELTTSRSHHVEALSLLGQPAPRRRAALLLLTLREVAAQIWIHLRPGRRRQSSTSAKKRQRLLAAGRSYNYLAEIYFFANDRLSFLFHAVRFANLSARAGPSAELAESCAAMSLLTSVRPLRFTCELYIRKVEDIDPAQVPADVRIRVLVLTMLAEYGLGRWHRVHARSPEAIEICERLKDRHHWGQLMSMLGSCALLEGDFDRGEEILQSLAAAGRHRNHPKHAVWGLCHLATLALRRGHPRRAAELIEEALHFLDLEEDHISGILCYGHLALARLRLGDRSAAEAAAEQASEQIGPHARVTASLALWGYTSTAEARLGLWRQAIADGESDEQLKARARAARLACRGVRAMGRTFSMCRPDALRCAGTLALLSGHRRRALRAWRRSLAAAEQLAMPYEQAQAHLELGRHLPASDPARRRHLDRAGEIFERLGCS